MRQAHSLFELVGDQIVSLRDLELRSTYKSGLAESDPIEEFLVPCLSESVTYDRLSGYFSSRIFALAAEGLAGFIQGQGRMRLLMSEQVTRSDLKALQEHYSSESPESFSVFFEALTDTDSLKTAIEREHLEAMCWLLKEGRLEVRIVAFATDEPSSGPIFHPKVGVFTDAQGNKVSFSGSVNETAAGWTGNIEEFKVFKSWQEATEEFVQSDEENFEFFWNGGASPNFETLSLPAAVRDRLVAEAPEDIPTLRRKSTSESSSEANWNFRDYQSDAIGAWVAEGFTGILAMATGTGKTKTALGCIEAARANGTTLIVVSAPYEHIARQWMSELGSLRPIMASGSSGWRAELSTKLNEVKMGWRTTVCVIGVQNTLATTSFSAYLEGLEEVFDNRLLVGDEVHGLGATTFQSVMRDEYNMRLGLSATPSRYFDEVGTDVLMSYFRKTVFEFNTAAALAWRDPQTGRRAICDFRYMPVFVDLDEDEVEKYEELSSKIAKFNQETLDFEAKKMLESLLFRRAGVIKGARSKIQALRQTLTERNTPIDFCLIYCHDMEQLLEVGEMLLQLGISYQKITGDESTKPDPRFQGMSHRDWNLQQFANGTTRVLLAIKCLDEGVDIPSARLAYILASSGNSREFIQRRGRLLRPAENKEFAEIYDFVVAPGGRGGTSLQGVLTKEIKRIKELAAEALNFDEVLAQISIHDTGAD